MSTLNMQARKKTWIALPKMSVKSKEIRTGKQTSKQTNEAITTARKKKKKKKNILQ